MKIQINGQTQNGIMGVMVSGWQTTTTVQQPVFQQWLSQGEWDAIVDDVAKATLPNGVDPKEGT